jgi:hypothetical protein
MDGWIVVAQTGMSLRAIVKTEYAGDDTDKICRNAQWTSTPTEGFS